LSFLKEFVTYYMSKELQSVVIRTPHEAGEYLSNLLGTYEDEVFLVLCLGAKGEVILQEKIMGSIDSVNINVRDLVDKILRVKAVRVLLAHNHPDGGINPSDADIRLTRTLVMALAPLGVDVMDHIIVGDKMRGSFDKMGLLGKFKSEYKRFEEGGA